MSTRYKIDVNKYIPHLLIYISYWLINHRENKDFQQQQQQQQQQQHRCGILWLPRVVESTIPTLVSALQHNKVTEFRYQSFLTWSSRLT